MIMPKVNINGSSIADLTYPRMKAMDHLMDAIEALKQATPNGRDYPGDTMRCVDDRNTHSDRISALRALREELTVEIHYIRGQA